MARVDVSIECSPGEFRRLAGRPHLLPVYEALALGLERFLVYRIADLGAGTGAAAEPGSEPRRAPSTDPSGDGPGAG
jgi:hypothetical protein